MDFNKDVSPKSINGVGDIISFTWDVFAKNVIFILLISVVTAGVLSVVDPYLTDLGVELERVGEGLQHDVFGELSDATPILIGVGIAITLIYYISIVSFLAITKHKKQFTLFEAWSDARPHVVPLFIVSVVISAIILAGLALLIIPGIFFAMWYMFVPYLRVENPKAPIRDLMKESRSLFKANRNMIFKWFLITIGLSLGASIVTYPPSVLLNEIPTVGVLLVNTLSAFLNNFFMLSFVVLYLHLQTTAPTSEDQPSN